MYTLEFKSLKSWIRLLSWMGQSQMLSLTLNHKYIVFAFFLNFSFNLIQLTKVRCEIVEMTTRQHDNEICHYLKKFHTA